MYKLRIIDSSEEIHEISFEDNQYENLMELIVNVIYEEIGDCRGRAWCGTCHVSLFEQAVLEEKSPLEEDTLSNLPNLCPSSRLACQIDADKEIDGLTFTLMKEG